MNKERKIKEKKIKESECFFPYLGRKKNKEIKPIYDLIENKKLKYNKIIEPFCGGFGLSYYFYNKGYKEDIILNDLDTNLINFYKDVKEDKLKDYIDKFNEFRKTLKYNEIDLNNYIYNKQTRNDAVYFKKGDIQKLLINKICDENNKDLFYFYLHKKLFNIYYSKIPKDDEKLEKYKQCEDLIKKSILYNEDAFNIIDKYKDDENALIYLDPPYYQSYNNEYNMKNYKEVRYNYNKNYKDMYIKIIELLKDKNIKATIIMTINKNDLLSYILKDNIIYEYDKLMQVTKKLTPCIIVSNNLNLKK